MHTSTTITRRNFVAAGAAEFLASQWEGAESKIAPIVFPNLQRALLAEMPVGRRLTVLGFLKPHDGGGFSGCIEKLADSDFPGGGNIRPITDNNTVSIAMWGARADAKENEDNSNATDNTSPISATCNFARRNGIGRVEFPSAEACYAITSPVQFFSRTEYYSDGRAKILQTRTGKENDFWSRSCAFVGMYFARDPSHFTGLSPFEIKPDECSSARKGNRSIGGVSGFYNAGDIIMISDKSPLIRPDGKVATSSGMAPTPYSRHTSINRISSTNSINGTLSMDLADALTYDMPEGGLVRKLPTSPETSRHVFPGSSPTSNAKPVWGGRKSYICVDTQIRNLSFVQDGWQLRSKQQRAMSVKLACYNCKFENVYAFASFSAMSGNPVWGNKFFGCASVSTWIASEFAYASGCNKIERCLFLVVDGRIRRAPGNSYVFRSGSEDRGTKDSIQRCTFIYRREISKGDDNAPAVSIFGSEGAILDSKIDGGNKPVSVGQVSEGLRLVGNKIQGGTQYAITLRGQGAVTRGNVISSKEPPRKAAILVRYGHLTRVTGNTLGKHGDPSAKVLRQRSTETTVRDNVRSR